MCSPTCSTMHAVVSSVEKLFFNTEVSRMIPVGARTFLTAILVLLTMAPLTAAQAPPDAGGSGTVDAGDTHGMATGKGGDKEQTVQPRDAQVGDQGGRKDQEGRRKTSAR